MTPKIRKPESDGHNIRLEIPEPEPKGNTNLVENWGSGLFQPGSEISNPTPSGKNLSRQNTLGDPGPEKKLTHFALRLAVLEKTASGLGALAFIWASVVLLGGFAVTLEAKDFWFVTVIVLIESARVFSRSHELEWQHEATKSPAKRNSFQMIASSSRFLSQAIKAVFKPLSNAQSRTSHSHRLSGNSQIAQQNRNETILSRTTADGQTWRTWDVPALPYGGWVFLSGKVGRFLFWLQLLSATACVTLSLMRLIDQDYGEITSQEKDKQNRNPALDIFYTLAVAEALMFLLEKAYWEWRVSYCKLLEEVCRECNLGISGMVPIKRFFYDVYSSCINGSIFDGLKMDLVSFAMELLNSNSSDEQLIGARILQIFAKHDRLAYNTLRKIGTSMPVIERLMEMLNWKSPDEEEIRRSAAEIISKLTGKKQNALRVGGIAGAMQSISTLLYTGETSDAKPHEISAKSIVADRMDYEFSAFNLLGLLILKKLACDHDNCGKIGSTRGLLAKIIHFTSTDHNLLRNDLAPESQIKAVRRSLQLVKTLVSETGRTGKTLRRDISDIVFTVSNIRELLQYGERHMVLQKLGIEILTSLAMDEDAREMIGSTGGVIKMLLSIFFKSRITGDQNSVSIEAGEALALLALESKRNCIQILREGEVVDQLMLALNDPVLRVNSSRILRNLCAYAGTEYSDRLRGVIDAFPTVLTAIMDGKDKLLEVSVGLATQIFRLTSSKEYDKELTRAGIKREEFVEKLVQILKKYNIPEIKVPRIRLFVVQLAIQMMITQGKYIQIFKNSAMEEVLQCVAETTSELENFNVFSGSVGLRRHKTTLLSLVDKAQVLMTSS